MEIVTEKIQLQTKGNTDIIDITHKVQDIINQHGYDEGNVLVFAVGSTAGLTTIEYEPGLKKDYPGFFEKIIPSSARYAHDDTWHDGNGHSHIRASLQGSSLQIPFDNGKLLLGTWQQIIFIDFDIHPRSRTIILQITGKKK